MKAAAQAGEGAKALDSVRSTTTRMDSHADQPAASRANSAPVDTARLRDLATRPDWVDICWVVISLAAKTTTPSSRYHFVGNSYQSASGSAAALADASMLRHDKQWVDGQ